MARPCSICIHERRAEIDGLLVSGASYRDVATRFGLSKSAVDRHREHLPAALVKAKEVEDIVRAIDVIQQLRAINGASLAVLRDARAAGDGELALRAVDRLQRQIELQAKLIGQLDERPQVNLLMAPEWLTVRTAMLEALRDFPEARTAVAARLMSLEVPA